MSLGFADGCAGFAGGSFGFATGGLGFVWAGKVGCGLKTCFLSLF